MSTDKGYIKLYRDIRDHWLWQNEPYDKAHAWADLIMRANYKTREIMFDGRLVTVKRGSFITSVKQLARDWGWSRHKVSDFLDVLAENEMITQKRDNKKTLINIEKYCIYQDQMGAPGTSEGHQKDITGTSEGHKQEYIKKAKEKENGSDSPSEDEPGEPWPDDFWEY